MAVAASWWAARGADLFIAPAELSPAVVEEAYAPVVLTAAGNACSPDDVSFRLASGALPEGLAINGAGQLSGVPKKMGTFQFQVEAATSCGRGLKAYTLVVTGAPVLEVEPREVELHVRAGAAPAEQTLMVRSTWPGLTYGIQTSTAPWLRAIPRRGRTPRPGAALAGDIVSVTADTKGLAPGAYTAELHFWSWEGANSPVVRVRLQVDAAEAVPTPKQ
jgi:hypothetical protein